MSSRTQKVLKALDKRVKAGIVSPEEAKAAKHKLNVTDQFMELYKEISKSPESRFTEGTLRKLNIELIPWDIKTSEGQPTFFKQIPLEEFQKYHLREFSLGELLDPREYGNDTKLELFACQNQAFNTQTEEPLIFDRGWQDGDYNYSLFNERGKDDNLDHRYEWGMDRLMEHEGAPHCIAVSTHQCDEPNRILRSELMILLLLMWAKGRLWQFVFDEITPVLLVSIRHNHIRVIEAHYDGSKVVIRYGDPLPVEFGDSFEKQQRTCHWVLRWLVSDPVGDTKSFPSPSASPPASAGS